MIKIKLLTSLTGSITAFPGETIEVSEKEAARHVAAGNAEYVNNLDVKDEMNFINVPALTDKNKKGKGKDPVIKKR